LSKVSIKELKDIVISENISNGSLLVYNKSTENWESKTIDEIIDAVM